MHKILLAFTLLVMVALIAGCGGRASGWRGKVTDTEGKPIKGAKLCVWQYPLRTKDPERNLAEITRAYSQGKMGLRGWFFYSDVDGDVLCDDIPVGREVVDAVTPGYTVRRPGRGHVRVIWTRDRDGHAVRREEYTIDDDRYVYVPPVEYKHWQPGEWLGVIVTAEGYEPYSFTFKPDGENGSLGTIQMIREDVAPTTTAPPPPEPPYRGGNNGG
ncbi:MAG: hypothetical protein WCJ56_02705 [bacterium]